MKDPARVTSGPLYYCPACLRPYDPNGDYTGCPECKAAQKEYTDIIIARSMRMNRPYWDWVADREAERRRMLYVDGDMCMSDGSICRYDNTREKARLERINSVHAGKDLRGPVLDEAGNYVER